MKEYDREETGKIEYADFVDISTFKLMKKYEQVIFS